MALRNLFTDPPFKAPMVSREDGRVLLTWLTFFQAIAKANKVLVYDVAYDPASIAPGAALSVSVTVTGARPGDFATASFDPGDAAIRSMADVTAKDTVTVTFFNVSAGAVDLAAGTLRVRVEVAR